jgi:hypothetical protein
LKSVDASAGTPKLPLAFSAAIACAANATSSRNGNMIRVSSTVSANLPGTCSNPGANSRTNCGLKIIPNTQSGPTTRTTAVATRLESWDASRFPSPASERVKTGTSADDSAPSAKRLRVRLGMRKASWNASLAAPAPNSRAITISRTMPVMRLSITAAETIPAE